MTNRQSRNDRSGDCGGDGPAGVEAAGFIGEKCYGDGEEESEEKLHEGEG